MGCSFGMLSSLARAMIASPDSMASSALVASDGLCHPARCMAAPPPTNLDDASLTGPDCRLSVRNLRKSL